MRAINVAEMVRVVSTRATFILFLNWSIDAFIQRSDETGLMLLVGYAKFYTVLSWSEVVLYGQMMLAGEK